MAVIYDVRVCSPSFSANPTLVAELRQICSQLTVNEGGLPFKGLDLAEFLKTAEIAVVGTERIDHSLVSKLPRLKFIAKYGVGTDNIDLQALKQSGIGFGWQGGVNRRSVAEMALCFLIGLFRNLFFTSFKLKSGVWDKRGGRQLSDRTIGIIGCGFVGSELIELLKPFACNIFVNDIVDKSEYILSQQASGMAITHVDLDSLVRQSDAISLHVPLTELTENLVNKDFLSKMKSDAFLINTSRGRVVEQSALKSALAQNMIAGAALDVFDDEPARDLDLLGLPNLVSTPHIGGNAEEAVLSMGRSAIEGIKSFLAH